MEGRNGREKWKGVLEGRNGREKWKGVMEGRNGREKWKGEMEGRNGREWWKGEMEGRNGREWWKGEMEGSDGREKWKGNMCERVRETWHANNSVYLSEWLQRIPVCFIFRRIRTEWPGASRAGGIQDEPGELFLVGDDSVCFHFWVELQRLPDNQFSTQNRFTGWSSRVGLVES